MKTVIKTIHPSFEREDLVFLDRDNNFIQFSRHTNTLTLSLSHYHTNTGATSKNVTGGWNISSSFSILQPVYWFGLWCECGPECNTIPSIIWIVMRKCKRECNSIPSIPQMRAGESCRIFPHVLGVTCGWFQVRWLFENIIVILIGEWHISFKVLYYIPYWTRESILNSKCNK